MEKRTFRTSDDNLMSVWCNKAENTPFENLVYQILRIKEYVTYCMCVMVTGGQSKCYKSQNYRFCEVFASSWLRTSDGLYRKSYL